MKNFNDWVNSQLVESINNYDKLSNSVYELLHLNKTKHNMWVVTKQQSLTLITDNPYLATQLRYQQKNICLHLNQTFLMQLKTVKIKIVPPTGTKEVIDESNYTVSEKAAEILAGIANEIDDAELKASLLKLTKN